MAEGCGSGGGRRCWAARSRTASRRCCTVRPTPSSAWTGPTTRSRWTRAGLAGFLAGCGPDWAGLSLTMPLKRAVLPLLDSASELVGVVGGANTVVFGSRGTCRSQHRRHRDHRGPARDRRASGAGGRAGRGSDRRVRAGGAGRHGVPERRRVRPAPRGRRQISSGSPSGSGSGWSCAAGPTGFRPGRRRRSWCARSRPRRRRGSRVLFPPQPGWLLDVSYAPWPPALVSRAWRRRGRSGGGRRRDAAPSGRRAGAADDRSWIPTSRSCATP